jgi:ABC-type molybdate transport system substrate-binding protein
MSKTEIIILVPKGNPRKIQSLADLAKEGLRVGLGNPEQSTLGALTRRLLEQAGILEQVMRNVATTSPTADLLVNQIRTGALDAVVVYTANTTQVREMFELIPIAMTGATAVQTYSVGANSKHRRLAERLYEALKSVESRARYEAAGFQWQE